MMIGGLPDDVNSKKYFGLEMQYPWSVRLLQGQKTIEVRNYKLPETLIGRKIFILESKQGNDGVSALDDTIELTPRESSTLASTNGPATENAVRVAGWCIFDTIKCYKNKSDFEADESQHLVSPNSGYAWQPEKTTILYGWVVKEIVHYENRGSERLAINFYRAERRRRSIFELFPL